jgi:hypothetical protein
MVPLISAVCNFVLTLRIFRCNSPAYCSSVLNNVQVKKKVVGFRDTQSPLFLREKFPLRQQWLENAAVPACSEAQRSPS